MVFFIRFASVLLCSIVLMENESATYACHLVPEKANHGASCLKLRAEVYITSSQSDFGPNIEGAGVSPRGEIFAVSYGGPFVHNLIGQVYPKQRLIYADKLRNSYFNGIRFRNEREAFVADAVNHRVLKLGLTTRSGDTVVTDSSSFCADPQMLQPNDLTLSLKTGTVFTSGMRWNADTGKKDGDIWACLPNGQARKLEVMGRTNGIDLSPDETILYVSESHNKAGVPYKQKIWRYDVSTTTGIISGKILFADFATVDGRLTDDIDGMKTDMQGNLYVTRHGGSKVVVFSPAGKVIGKIALNFPNPTNLEFGGPSGTTLYIVGKCSDNANKGCVDKIEVKHPGRTWKLLQQ